jgi:integrase
LSLGHISWYIPIRVTPVLPRLENRMPAKTLTDTMIRAMANPAKRREIPDRISQVYLIVQPSGAKSWAVRYRLDRREKKLTLGSYPKIGLAAARDLARKAHEDVAGGKDPAIRKHRSGKIYVETLLDQYLETKRDLRSHGEVSRMLKVDMSAKWRGRLVSSIQAPDVEMLLNKKKETAPVSANRLQTLMKGYFKYAVKQHLITTSPMRDVDRPAKEKPRKRFFSHEELQKIWAKTQLGEWPYHHIIRLIMLTGQRRDEVASAEWGEFDFAARTWTIPGAKTKNKLAQVVPLTDAMIALVKALPRIDGTEFLFPTRKAKRIHERHFSGWSKAKAKLAKELEFKVQWGQHDFRRNIRTACSAMRVNRIYAERILNHVPGAKTMEGVYDQYEFFEEKREAIEAWQQYLIERAGVDVTRPIDSPPTDPVPPPAGRRSKP